MNKVIFSLILLFGIISCGSNNEDDMSSYIDGYYLLTEFSKDKANWSETNANGLHLACTIRLTSEGFFSCAVPYSSFNGTYSVKNNHFIFTKSSKEDPLNDLHYADLSNGIMTAELLINGTKYYFRNKK